MAGATRKVFARDDQYGYEKARRFLKRHFKKNKIKITRVRIGDGWMYEIPINLKIPGYEGR